MALSDDGDMRGRAPNESGKADRDDSDDSSGGDSLDGGGRGRLRGGREPVGGALRDSAGVTPLSLDVPESSEDEEVEEDVEEEVEDDDAAEDGGLPLLLDARVLVLGCCSRRGWARCAGVEL